MTEENVICIVDEFDKWAEDNAYVYKNLNLRGIKDLT